MGVDGSDASEVAFQTVLNGLRRPEDSIVVGNIHDTRKDFLPYNLKPTYIRETYTCKLLTLGDKGVFASRQFTPAPEDGKTTKTELWSMAEDQNATVIVTGMHGRKGPKSDPTVAGTTVRFLADNASFPIVIVKDLIVRQKKSEGKYRFGVCFDTSSRSKNALRTVLAMMRPDDALTCIVVKEPAINENTVDSSINSICAEFNVSHQRIKRLERQPGESIYKCIKNYLIFESHEGNYIDFVAVGNNGANHNSNSDTTLGSVADAVIRAQRMNVIFCP